MCRLSFSRAARRWLLTLGMLAAVVVPTTAQDALPLPGVTTVYLEVILNGAPTGLIAAFAERADGSLSIDGVELAELGIAADPAAQAPDGQYDLSAMPGLTYVYDRAQQIVLIDTDMERLRTRVIDEGATGEQAPVTASSTGAALNYTLSGSLGAHTFAAAATLDARFFSEAGLFTQSAIAGALPDGRFDVLRLDSTFQRSDPAALRTFKAGDFISGGLSWTRPVRLAGLQIARNFDLRPDLVTMPLPSFDGTAAVPSTIDIYTNGAQVYSGTVPAGPFSVTNLPILSNAGPARLLVTDAAGRTVETTQPFFTSPRLLQRGLLDYSLEAGLPRRNFGRESFDYAPAPAASASARYGLTDHLTIEGHAEATGGLINGGVGVLMPLGGMGLGSVAAAASVGEGAGVQLAGDLSLRFGEVQVRFSSRHTFGDYADIASISAVGGGAAPPPAFDQASLTLPVGDGGSATFSATRTALADGTERTMLGLAWGRRLAGTTSVSLYGYTVFGDDPGAGIVLGLSRPLGADMSLSAGLSMQGDSPTGSIEVARSEPAAGGWGWRVGASGRRGGGETDNAPHLNGLAAVSYAGSVARGAVALRSFARDTSVTAEVSGAVAVAGGGVFLARRFNDAFAVVNVGSPGVVVRSQNRAVGRTDSRGRLLVPDLHAWQANSLSIDVEDLPIGVEAEATRKEVVPSERAGVVVDFAVRSLDAAAIVVFRTADGKFIPAGTPGETETGEAFVVGYDGEAYMRDLKPRNRVVIETASGNCIAVFDFAPDPEAAQPVIEDVTCVV